MQKNYSRYIAHMDLDAFYVSVERLHNSNLINKPVIIGGSSDRGVVSTCSYEARKYGVHSAMPIAKAKQLCPKAIFVSGNMQLYEKYSNMVSFIINSNVPVHEKASIDEHYIDLTGMDKFYNIYDFCIELKDKITKKTGLPISFGLSINKTVAKIATGEAKKLPARHIFIKHKEVQNFLNPLSITKIPMLGPKASKMLNKYGIETIEQLSKTSPEHLIKLLGKNGIVIWEKANGIDNNPVVQERTRKSIGSEETFELDTNDIRFMNDLIVKTTEQLCYELRTINKFTECLAVKIKYANFKTKTIQKTFSATNTDKELITVAKELFQKLYDKTQKVRLLGVRFSNLVDSPSQLSLFGESKRNSKLYEALDKIRTKFGDDAVGRASGK